MRERSYNAKAKRAVNQLQPPQAPKRGNQSSQIPCHTLPKFNIDPENDGWKLEDDPSHWEGKLFKGHVSLRDGNHSFCGNKITCTTKNRGVLVRLVLKNFHARF